MSGEPCMSLSDTRKLPTAPIIPCRRHLGTDTARVPLSLPLHQSLPTKCFGTYQVCVNEMIFSPLTSGLILAPHLHSLTHYRPVYLDA
jgi:hypothetical protein